MKRITTVTVLIGLFSFLGKAQDGPYQDEAINEIYELLFCDQIELYNALLEEYNEYPWNVLSSGSQKALKKLVEDEEVESRTKILAYRKLKNLPKETKLLGVIIEAHLPEGLDILAAYADGSARYINYTGNMVVWEKSTKESEELIQQLFKSGQSTVSKIGPWDKQRLPAPTKGNTRLTFLVEGEIYFEEAPTEVLFNDPLAGNVLLHGAYLMQYLISQ